ncbi:UbiA family prenyltransferase [Streptomyces sp. JHA26]|uniref:UbiA family prenyltransferase n=1 Tax=Streptomyces sp. JHA26 TaxID=1917143 RepID=UPI000D1C095A|nr:UbiA family prenyltransferase [Streptomyces sp. JHA26]
MTALAVFGRFFLTRFPLARYSIYVLLLPAAVQSTLATRDTPGGPLGPARAGHVAGLAGLLCVLLFMRVVDEIKDLDYDRVFNRDRPLVTGEVSLAAARTYLAGSAAPALVSAAAAGPGPVAAAAAIMAYSLFLLGLERLSPRFRDAMWGNIVVTVQLKTGVLLYAVLLARTAGAAAPAGPSALTVSAFLLAYVSWEVARKTVREPFARPGEKLYSTAVGATASVAVAAVLLLAACGCRVAVAASWQSWGTGWQCAFLLPPTALAWGWVRLRRGGERYAPGGPALLAYVVFLAVPVAHWAATGRPVA